MALKGIALCLGAALVALAETSWAERASNWRVYKVADGLAESACLSVTVAPQGKVLRRLGQTHLGKFCGMTPAHDGGLWIAGARGLAKVTGPARNLTPESEWREYSLPEALQIQNLQEPQEDQEGGVTAVAESATN